MNNNAVTPGEPRRLHWTPIKFSPSDVENFLSKEAHSKYFKSYVRNIRKLNRLIQKGELSDIVYRVSTNETEDGTWSIKLQVESDLATASIVDPAFSTLNIQARPSQVVTASGGSKTKVSFEWQIQ